MFKTCSVCDMNESSTDNFYYSPYIAVINENEAVKEMSSHIEEICKAAARRCASSYRPDVVYEDQSFSSFKETAKKRLDKYHKSNNSDIVEDSRIIPLIYTNKNIEGLVRNWKEFCTGEKYYIWARKISRDNCKVFIMKYLIRELNGDILNVCVVKQCDGPKTKKFTLTESDCEYIGINFEPGLEIYPVNVGWVKY